MDAGGGGGNNISSSLQQSPPTTIQFSNLYCTAGGSNDDHKPINEMDFFAHKKDDIVDVDDQSTFTDDASDHVQSNINVSVSLSKDL